MKTTFRPALLPAIFCLPLLVTLSGCGSDDPAPATTTALSVTPSLGLIRNATVSVKNADGSTAGTATMDATTGVVSVNATGTGPWIVEVAGNSTAAYFDEAKGTFVSFPAGSVLHALVPTGTSSVGVTGLTELAYAIWDGADKQLSNANVAAANTSVLNAFAAGTSLTSVLTPPRVVGAPLAAGALTNAAADVYATVLAGIAELGNAHASNPSAPALTAIAQLSRDFADGTLDGQQGSTAISGALYTAASFTTDLQASVQGVSTDFGTGATIAIALPPAPAWSNAGAGFPAARVHSAQTSTGSACSVTVSGSNATVTAGSYSYTVPLEGEFFETTGGNREVGPLIFASGTVRLYPGHGGQNSVDLTLDANGDLIYAYASHITDNSMLPAAGANVSIWCAGSAFTGAVADLPPTGANDAAASLFTSTALVGTYNAPYNGDGSGSCNFTLDVNGNITLNTSPITALANGTVISYTALNSNSQTATYAEWNFHPTVGGDSYAMQVIRQASGATLLNILTNGSNPRTCSTANDPAGAWAAIGAQAGTYSGTTNLTGNTDMAHGNSHACSLVVSANGNVAYTASNGETLNAGPVGYTAVVGKTTLNNGSQADYIETLTFALTLDLAHGQIIATKDYTYYDYCNLPL